MGKIRAEYIWMDGNQPTSKLGSKTKVCEGPITDIGQLPDWGFDGSSTNQADGNDSDCAKKPVYFIPDPIRGEENILVMCEVYNADGTPHKTNTRAALRVIAEKFADHDPWFGIEQEYTFLKVDLHWDSGRWIILRLQGPFYCGVGADEVYGKRYSRRSYECLYDGRD